MARVGGSVPHCGNVLMTELDKLHIGFLLITGLATMCVVAQILAIVGKAMGWIALPWLTVLFPFLMTMGLIIATCSLYRLANYLIEKYH